MTLVYQLQTFHLFLTRKCYKLGFHVFFLIKITLFVDPKHSKHFEILFYKL